jgi:hypothetical protein
MHRFDDKVSKNLWNGRKLLPDYTAQHPRRQSSPIRDVKCTLLTYYIAYYKAYGISLYLLVQRRYICVCVCVCVCVIKCHK